MQVIVNIGEDGEITTQIKNGPAMTGLGTTDESAAILGNDLNAGESPFSAAEETATAQANFGEEMGGLDGGAGPQSLR